MTQYVYSFSEGNKDMRNLLGGKGANLAEMKGLGLPVPDGFTVTTEACNKYYDDGEKIADEVIEQIMNKLNKLDNHITNEDMYNLTLHATKMGLSCLFHFVQYVLLFLLYKKYHFGVQ